MTVFIDTNVLLDALGGRAPFEDEALRIWTLVDQGRIRGLISAISFNNCHYILRKAAGRPAAQRAVRLLRAAFVTVPLDQDILSQAIDSSFPDFEDAIQFYSALAAKADCLISRNPGHFPGDTVPVKTPGAFLAAHFPD